MEKTTFRGFYLKTEDVLIIAFLFKICEGGKPGE
jgi:hypothetical protein